VSGTAIGLGYSKAYGICADDNITIGTLSGNVSGTGVTLGLFGGYASAYGLYAGKDITIDTLSGKVSGTGTADGVGLIGAASAWGYGLYAQDTITIRRLSGTVEGTGKVFGGIIGAGSASAYGLYAGKDINIGIVSGEVKAQSTNYWLRVPFLGNNAYGIYAEGTLNGGKPDRPVFITGKVFAEAPNNAIAVSSAGAMNIYVTGTLSGKDTSWFSGPADNGYAIQGGAGDDMVSLDTGATIIGQVDLGKGTNTLNLYGSNSLTNYFTHITNLNIGDGTRGIIGVLTREHAALPPTIPR
jgi:hypothetical protein